MGFCNKYSSNVPFIYQYILLMKTFIKYPCLLIRVLELRKVNRKWLIYRGKETTGRTLGSSQNQSNLKTGSLGRDQGGRGGQNWPQESYLTPSFPSHTSHPHWHWACCPWTLTALSGLLTACGDVSLMSGYVVRIVFSHIVERIMTQTLEVNCLFNSLSRYFKDLWALSASQFVTVWKQHDFLEKWPMDG